MTHDIRFDEVYASFCIPADAIDRHHVIAHGGFGIVYLATLYPFANFLDLQAPVTVAMKRILPARTSDVRAVNTFMDEIRLHARLWHKNIVEFVGFTWTTLQNLSAVTEYMEHGDLWTFINTTTHLTWGVDVSLQLALSSTVATTNSNTTNDEGSYVSKFTILCDVVDALVYLHTMNIIHRDLKTKNVLLDATGVAKLTDFGVSRETILDTMTAEIGTVAWTAPEILKGVRQTFSFRSVYFARIVILTCFFPEL